jgi:hypothetical protein
MACQKKILDDPAMISEDRFSGKFGESKGRFK